MRKPNSNDNRKSDFAAKHAYCIELRSGGYNNVCIVRSPADVVAEKDGRVFYFEIKMTEATSNYFGAATLTEWRAAYENPETYFFVICQKKEGGFYFTKYSPEEFEKFSSIPPFKIFFNVPLVSGKKMLLVRKSRTAVGLSKVNLELLDKMYSKLKCKHDETPSKRSGGE